MPTFSNLELLSSVRTKINDAITIADGQAVAISDAVTAHEGLADPHPQYALETDFTETAQDAIGGMVDSSLVYTDVGPTLSRAALTGAVTATEGSNATSLGSFTVAALSAAISDANISGTNTGDQTTIVGITGTKAQFDTAVSDGNILYVGDAPTAHTHVASEVTDFSEAVDDRVAALLVAGTNVTSIAYVDGSNTLTVNAATQAGTTNLSYTAATRVLASDTGTDATLPLMSSGDAGLVPASGGGTANFLRADGTFAAPPGGGSGLTQPQVFARMSMGY